MARPLAGPNPSISNSEVHSVLGDLVARKYLSGNCHENFVSLGSLTANYFSFTFSVDVDNSDECGGVYVKIPKRDSRSTFPEILPITEEDRQLARHEEQSLRALASSWPTQELNVHWVKLLGFEETYNALITERVYADSALTVFRSWDLRRRMGSGRDARKLRQTMGRLGGALAGFHMSNAGSAVFDLQNEMFKFKRYCDELSALTTSPWPTRALEAIGSLSSRKFKGTTAPTLKGIDIRNVLIDSSGRLTLLDPGRTKVQFREADLARFLMTYRILYWGSTLLLFARQPDHLAEISFLDAYYAVAGTDDKMSEQLFCIFLVKEQLKHWHTALESLSRLQWSATVKKCVARIYVNPFYNRQLATSLKRISKP